MVKINKNVKFLKGVIFLCFCIPLTQHHCAANDPILGAIQGLLSGVNGVNMEQAGEDLGLHQMAKAGEMMHKTFARMSVVLTVGVLAYIFKPVLVDLYRLIKKFF